MKIYDCFIFFNELDLLEIRLSELDDKVDYFVLVESNQTHARAPKKLYYEENKKRFKKWEDKIIHIVMDMPKLNFFDKILIKKQLTNPSTFLANIALSYGLGRMKMDWAQRSAIKKGLKNCKNEDVIIISDLDEIPNPLKLDKAISLVKNGKIVGFEQKTFAYYLNGSTPGKALSSKMCSYEILKKRFNKNPQRLRIPSFFRRLNNRLLMKKGYHNNIWNAGLSVIEDGGWHFTFLGGIEAVKTKIKNYPHVENFSIEKDLLENKIREDMERGNLRHLKINYIPIDSSFPETIQKNQEKYSHLIKKI